MTAQLRMFAGMEPPRMERHPDRAIYGVAIRRGTDVVLVTAAGDVAIGSYPMEIAPMIAEEHARSRDVPVMLSLV